MFHSIENDFLKVSVNELGAELHSVIVKKSNRQAIWQAGEEGYWPRQAPILFPHCGCLPHNKFTHNGKEYTSSQHGFLRDKTFALVSNTGDSVTLASKSDDETKVKYPFDYEVQITFSLNDNMLTHQVKVLNLCKEDMYFNVGFHPGFNCPFDDKHTFEDYDIVFEQKETPRAIEYNFETGFNKQSYETLFENSNVWPCKNEMFDNDSKAIDNLKSKWVRIVEKDTGRYINVDVEGFPYTIFWSCLAKPVKFICVEPWDGINAMQGASYELKEKYLVKTLQPQKEYITKLNITFEE